MNTDKLHNTRKRLTLVFTMVILTLFIVLGAIFLTAKYYNEQRLETRQFLQQVTAITTLAKTQKDLSGYFTKINKFREGQIFGDIKKRGEIPLQAENINFFILDTNKNIVFQHVIQEPHFDSLDFSKKLYYSDDGTYIAVRDMGKKWAVFYQEKRYDFDDVLSDILLLLFLALVFGAVFYVVGYKLVNQALRPVVENMQDMSDFIYNAGHELKTPLAVMRGNLQVMSAEEKLDKKLVKKSIKEVDNMNALIEGLRELSEAGGLTEKQTLALATEVDRYIKELSDFAKKKGVTLENTVQGKFMVLANPQELGVVLKNILKNAIKYNKKGGEVQVSLSKNILTITDTGLGISEQDMDKIFDRFYQGASARSEEGFGIGLSLVKKIADANNWKIEVESEEGKGTEFKVVF